MKPCVLVADDDEDSRAVAREALLIAGYEVFEAADGEELLEAVSRRAPDMILLDLGMPKVDGWEVARRLRGGSRRFETPIVAYTAHALAGDKEKALESGCDDYLAKPCSPKDVVRKASFWVGKRGAGGVL